jgi:hypothetical protein
MIIFDELIAFADGRCCDREEVIANPQSRRTVVFRALEPSNLHRIHNIKNRTYRLVDLFSE